MKRVLSLLLLVPFLTVQAWALRGGPYDGLNGRSLSALAGMYGVVLTGNVELNEAGRPKDPTKPEEDPVNPETTGVMVMSIPGSGMASGRILIFAQGLMYLGNAQGIVDQRSGKIALVSQVSHYVSRVATNGLTTQSGIAVDAILSGKMDLALSLDYISGLIEVAGGAKYFRYDPLLARVVLDTNTSSAVNNAVSNQNKNENQVSSLNSTAGQGATASQNKNQNQVASENANAVQSATAAQNKNQNQVASENANANQTATATQNKNQNQVASENANASQTATATQSAATNTAATNSIDSSLVSSTTNTIANPDGSSTTNSESTGTSSNSLSGSTTNTNSISGDSRNSDLTKGSSVTAGSLQASTVTQASDLAKGSSVTAGSLQASTVTQVSDLAKGSTVTAGSVQTSIVTEASDLAKGSTVTAGTATTVGTTQNATNTITTTKYDIAAVRQAPVARSFMTLAATGVRQDTTASPLAPFTPPTEATSFQIEVALPPNGGANGGAAPQPGN